MLANGKIEQDKENDHIHRVFVDGKQIEKITHLDFQIDDCYAFGGDSEILAEEILDRIIGEE